MDMLDATLRNDTSGLEKILLENINHVNDPIGLPFDTPNSRFYNHPIMNEMVILQHPDQTLLDIACGMPCGPIIWVLLAQGAKGTRHPLGTDLALHNAIKNGRPYTVQALLVPGRSHVNGFPDNAWKPLLQAAFWNHPEVVRTLLRRGANINDIGLSPSGIGSCTALQLCLERRIAEYQDPTIRGRCNQILKMLLEAGADINIPPPPSLASSLFEMFIKPIQDMHYWAKHLAPLEVDCLGLFVSKGADLKVQFNGILCGSPSSQTFAHQTLWHSTPGVSRLIVDQVSPSPQESGNILLHEVLGSCPDAKRHPADSLRDIHVLLKKGVDINLPDITGITPLRKCIEKCPAVDLVDRLQVLLDAGADPELPGPDGVQPYVLAARTFEEPLLSKVMQTLVARMKGHPGGMFEENSSSWDTTHFPITDDQTYSQVVQSFTSTSDFRTKVHDLLPEDVHTAFNQAYFTVVSDRYLDTMTKAAKIRTLTGKEKGDIASVLDMRRLAGCDAYKFDQELVLALLNSRPGLNIVSGQTDSEITDSANTEDHSITSASPTHTPFQFRPGHSTADLSPRDRNHENDESSDDFFFIESASIRWKDPTANPPPGTNLRTAEALLQHKCITCDDGNLLTKAELTKHESEHAHTEICQDAQCKRRFCQKKRRKDRDVGCQDHLFANNM